MVHLVSETREQVRRDRLLRLPDVEKATGLKKSSIYLLMKRGEFPHSAKASASGRCVAWPESRVLQWVQDRISQADKAKNRIVQADSVTTETPAGDLPKGILGIRRHRLEG